VVCLTKKELKFCNQPTHVVCLPISISWPDTAGRKPLKYIWMRHLPLFFSSKEPNPQSPNLHPKNIYITNLILLRSSYLKLITHILRLCRLNLLAKLCRATNKFIPSWSWVQLYTYMYNVFEVQSL
jgi:hypothetical protein